MPIEAAYGIALDPENPDLMWLWMEVQVSPPGQDPVTQRVAGPLQQQHWRQIIEGLLSEGAKLGWKPPSLLPVNSTRGYL